jgi:hypothetical protein
MRRITLYCLSGGTGNRVAVNTFTINRNVGINGNSALEVDDGGVIGETLISQPRISNGMWGLYTVQTTGVAR